MPFWIIVVEWLARVILVLLIVLSVWSISIILDRIKFLKKFDHNFHFESLKKQLNSFSNSKNREGLNHSFFELHNMMAKGLSVLGTLGSTTPFIGLLGTILGIIVAFGELSNTQGNTNDVMFALAEALILTAVGLFVAIPAVIAFNMFNKKIKYILGDLQGRIDTYLAQEK